MGRRRKDATIASSETAIATVEKNGKERNEVDLEAIKTELTTYIDSKMKSSYTDEIDKANKRLIREKNKKIIFRNIIIIILLAIIGGLLFLMYRNNYFSKFLTRENTVTVKEDEKKEDNSKEEENGVKEEIKKPTLEELKTKYASLLDYYTISKECKYKTDLYSGNLSKELRNYMTLNSFNFTSIKVEDEYNILNESTFRKVYDTLFTTAYEAASFDYDNNKIRYLSGLDTYMSTTLLVKSLESIKREIIEIEENDEILITTIEGIIDNNKLYNVLTNEEISNYQADSILNYQDKLNKITYHFKDGKLVSLSK